MRKKDLIKSVTAVVLGNALYALTVQLFLVPSGLITGGTTGIALALNHLFDISISGFVFVFNAVMLAMGLIVLGKRFFYSTILSSLVFPAALWIFERVFSGYVLTDNAVLCAVFSGLGIGISLGVVIRNGASTGGMDIPPLVFNKLFGLPVSETMYVFDVLILMGQAFQNSTENILFGILIVLIYTITLDKILLAGSSRTEVKIISEHTEEIRTAILNEMDRGVTLLHGEGGFSGKDKELVMSVITNRELSKMEHLIHLIDPEAFMIISRVSEVSGRGFTLNKKYENNKGRPSN